MTGQATVLYAGWLYRSTSVRDLCDSSPIPSGTSAYNEHSSHQALRYQSRLIRSSGTVPLTLRAIGALPLTLFRFSRTHRLTESHECPDNESGMQFTSPYGTKDSRQQLYIGLGRLQDGRHFLVALGVEFRLGHVAFQPGFPKVFRNLPEAAIALQGL